MVMDVNQDDNSVKISCEKLFLEIFFQQKTYDYWNTGKRINAKGNNAH